VCKPMVKAYLEEPPPSRVTPERRRGRRSAEDPYRPESITPTKASPGNALSPPRTTPLRKPSGPRRATLAPPKSAPMYALDVDVETALEETIAAFSPPHFSESIEDGDTPTKPFFDAPSFEAPVFTLPLQEGVVRTPTRSSTASVEPLSIKKKTSVKPRRSPGSFRRIHAPDPPSPTPASKLTHTASMIRSPPRVQHPSRKGKDVERIVVVARTTKEDVRIFWELHLWILTESCHSYHPLGGLSNASSKKWKSFVTTLLKIPREIGWTDQAQ